MPQSPSPSCFRCCSVPHLPKSAPHHQKFVATTAKFGYHQPDFTIISDLRLLFFLSRSLTSFYTSPPPDHHSFSAIPSPLLINTCRSLVYITFLSGWKPDRVTFDAASDPKDAVTSVYGYGDLVKRGIGMATVGLSSDLFERGQICGGCFELRCVDNLKWCYQGTSIIVTVTNFCQPNYGLQSDTGVHCNPPNKHFILPIDTFEKITFWKASNMNVQYRRFGASCGGKLRCSQYNFLFQEE